MNRERLSFGASLGGILGYALAVFTSYPIRLVYDPHAAAWGAVDAPGQPVIHWYGWVLNAGLGALLGMAIAGPIRREVRWRFVWIVAVIVLVVLAYHERHWVRP